MAEPLVPLGEIVTTHGLNGWLKLNAFNPSTNALSPGVEVFLEHGGRRSAHRLEASSQHKKQFLIKLGDINSIDDAARYIGSTLAVGEAALEALEPNQYYHYQIIGFEVFHLNEFCSEHLIWRFADIRPQQTPDRLRAFGPFESQ